MDITVIDADEALRRANRWQAEGIAWHFHMLPPTCTFSPGGSGRHLIILEPSDSSEIAGVWSDIRDMQLGEQLARIVHPSVFSGTEDVRDVPWLNEWTARMAQLNRDGVPWHHHMLYPSCVLNRQPGQFALVFEDPATRQPQERRFPEQPEGHFNTIERLYWAQQNPASGADAHQAASCAHV